MSQEREADKDYFNSMEEAVEGHMALKSSQKGPCILLIGGTHGNEPAGVKALIELHQYLVKNPHSLLKGEVHFLLANPRAYIANKRYIDFDLNRLFTAQTDEKIRRDDYYEYRRAKEITAFIKSKKFDASLDMHSVSKGDEQMMIYPSGNKNCENLAQSISSITNHSTFTKGLIKGLLIEETMANSKSVSLAIECGNHHNPNGPFLALNHCYMLLRHFEMMSEKKQWQTLIGHHLDITQYNMIEPIRPGRGFEFSRTDYLTGSALKKGTVYASDYLGEYKAPEDCYLVMPPDEVRPNDYDAGFLCRKNIISARKF